MTISKLLHDMDETRKKEKDPARYKHLTSAVKSWMKAWPAQSTYTDVLRASQLYFLCHREFVLNYWQPKDNRDFNYKSYLMMTTGTHLHHYIQNYVLGPMGVLWGNWVLTHKKHTQTGFHPAPKKALQTICKQGNLPWAYEELDFYDEGYRIAGHIDGQLDLARIDWLHHNSDKMKENPEAALREMKKIPTDERNLINLEIKTCGSWVFENLVDSKSIPEYYKMQAEIYQHATGVHKTAFWYINRDTMDSKIILYDYSGNWWKDATRKAKIVWQSIRDETLPISGMACHTPKDKRAKDCAFRTPCFDEMDFSEYVRKGKEQAESEGRKLLDLSRHTFD